jgi:hypothetical protein
MQIELTQRDIDRIAQRTALIVMNKLQGQSIGSEEWVGTREAARILGVSETWLRKTKDNYPHVKGGDSRQSTLRFLRSGLIKGFGSKS